MESQTRNLPSGEKLGAPSWALFSPDTDLGGAEPSDGTTHTSLFVDQAASRPASLAAKATHFESGLIVRSSVPPKGWSGVSMSKPAIKSIGAPPPIFHAKAWLRFPSSQESQWRTIRR